MRLFSGEHRLLFGCSCLPDTDHGESVFFLKPIRAGLEHGQKPLPEDACSNLSSLESHQYFPIPRVQGLHLYQLSIMLPFDPSVSSSANQSINPSIELYAVCARVDGCTIVQISSRFGQNRSSSCQWTNTQKMTGSLPRSSRERHLSLFFTDSCEIWTVWANGPGDGPFYPCLFDSARHEARLTSLPSTSCERAVGGCFARPVRLVGDGTPILPYRANRIQIRSPIWPSDAARSLVTLIVAV